MPVQFGEPTEMGPPPPSPPPRLDKIDEAQADKDSQAPIRAINKTATATSSSWSRVLCLGYDDVGDSDEDKDSDESGGGKPKRNSSLLQFMFGGSSEGDAQLTEEEKTYKKYGKIQGRKPTVVVDGHHLKDYVSFVPRKVLPQLPHMVEAKAECSNLQGVVSFLDIAGFTKLTERLAMQPDGAERLAKIINKLMGQLLDTLTTGDVIKFSGDAILVLYEPDPSFLQPEAEGGKQTGKRKGSRKQKQESSVDSSKGGYEDLAGMRNAAHRAVSEGLRALHDDYTVPAEDLGKDYVGDGDEGEEGRGGGGDIKLALHVAICAGDLELMHVGGVFGRWEVVMAGQAMAALGPTADLAPTDHLVVEEKCWNLLAGSPSGLCFEGTHLPAPNQTFVRVLNEIGGAASSGGVGGGLGTELVTGETGFNPLASMVESVLELVDLGVGGTKKHHSLASEMAKGMQLEHLAVLRRYVSPVIQRAISARTLNAVSCFTDVSVLFVGLSGVDLGLKSEEADMLWGQIVMSTVQDCVYDQEGAVNKFVMDDKGALLLCAWGLPPMAHADDPHRATSAALQLSKELKELGINARVKVTTGKVFAGVIGPPHRCEFSMLGDTVNLAARLMGSAPFGGVLCDEPTYASAALTGVEFEVLKPIKVKGKEGLIPIAKPIKDTRHENENGDGDNEEEEEEQGGGRKSSPGKGGKTKAKKKKPRDPFESGTSVLSQGHMRTKEREQLFDILDSLYLSGGGMLVLSGDAGSGKSELAKSVLTSAETYNSRVIQSLTPKNKGKVSDVSAKPCKEMSQILRGLLTPEAATNQTANGGKKASSMAMFGIGRKAGAAAAAAAAAVPFSAPTTVTEWRERLAELVNGDGGGGDVANTMLLLEKWAHVYDDYFGEWVDSDSGGAGSSRGRAGSQTDEAGSSLAGVASLLSSSAVEESSSSSSSSSSLESVGDAVEVQRAAAMSRLKSRASASNLGNPSSFASAASTNGASSPPSSSSSSDARGDDNSLNRRNSPRPARGRGQSIDNGAVDGGANAGVGVDDAEWVGEEAKARLVLLSKVLDRVLSPEVASERALLLFVHVRTGSSLSADAAHPEMWGFLNHLGEYAAARHSSSSSSSDVDTGVGAWGVDGSSSSSSGSSKPFQWLASVGDASPAQEGNALVVALTHRRALEFGGRAMNKAYASVIANAEKCKGLLQLDPLDHNDREAYLCLSLRVSKVPPEVSKWVSSVANGNPQYIELCAKLVDKPSILQRVNATTAVLCLAKGGAGALACLEKPTKILGFVKQTLGSLGPQDKLVVQILSLFRLESESASDLMPLPTTLVLMRAYQTIALLEEKNVLNEVLDRLAMYGLVGIHEVHEPPAGHRVRGRPLTTLEDEEARHKHDFYYTLLYPLLQDMAEEQLLASQKSKVMAVLTARRPDGATP